MAPPNTDSVAVLAQEVEKIDLKKLAREKGRYLVYPDTKVTIFVLSFLRLCFH